MKKLFLSLLFLPLFANAQKVDKDLISPDNLRIVSTEWVSVKPQGDNREFSIRMNGLKGVNGIIISGANGGVTYYLDFLIKSRRKIDIEPESPLQMKFPEGVVLLSCIMASTEYDKENNYYVTTASFAPSDEYIWGKISEGGIKSLEFFDCPGGTTQILKVYIMDDKVGTFIKSAKKIIDKTLKL